MTNFVPPLWAAHMHAWVDSAPDDDPDLFTCDVCGEDKDRDEMHHGTWSHVGEVYFCDACAVRP